MQYKDEQLELFFVYISIIQMMSFIKYLKL
jgi:hypothetical protein